MILSRDVYFKWYQTHSIENELFFIQLEKAKEKYEEFWRKANRILSED